MNMKLPPLALLGEARPCVEPYDTELSPEIEGNTSLDFLQAIYRSADQPLQRRMRAAIAALPPHEHPKCAVISRPGGGSGLCQSARSGPQAQWPAHGDRWNSGTHQSRVD